MTSHISKSFEKRYQTLSEVNYKVHRGRILTSLDPLLSHPLSRYRTSGEWPSNSPTLSSTTWFLSPTSTTTTSSGLRTPIAWSTIGYWISSESSRYLSEMGGAWSTKKGGWWQHLFVVWRLLGDEMSCCYPLLLHFSLSLFPNLYV